MKDWLESETSSKEILLSATYALIHYDLHSQSLIINAAITKDTGIVWIRSITPNKTQDTYVRYVAPTQTLISDILYIVYNWKFTLNWIRYLKI